MVRNTAPSRRNRICLAVATALMLPLLLAGGAQANFVKLPGAVDQACKFDSRYTFNFVANPAFNDLVVWDVALNGPVANNTVNLTAGLKHTLGLPECDKGHGANAAGSTFTFAVARPAAGAVRITGQAALITHGNHADAFRAVVTASGAVGGNPATGSLHTSGLHTPGIGLAASIENTGTTPLKNVTVTPSYFNPQTGLTTNGAPINRPNIAVGGSDRVNLPNSGTLAPTNYTISASGSPTTQTTVAFLGTWDGMPAELPLGDFAELFASSGFVLPLLRASDNLTDLFVAVDLTQWLSDPRSFAAGDVFTFTAGVSDALPGFVVGTSAVTFDAVTGTFMTNNPYNDDAYVAATIDGTVTPEPSSLALLLGSLLVLGAMVLRRRTR